MDNRLRLRLHIEPETLLLRATQETRKEVERSEALGIDGTIEELRIFGSVAQETRSRLSIRGDQGFGLDQVKKVTVIRGYDD